MAKNPVGFLVSVPTTPYDQTDFDDIFVRKDCFGDGGLWVWGDNCRGQLATCNLTYASSPVQTVSGGTNWLQIDTLGRSFHGIKTDGTLWGWGTNGAYRLGVGDYQPRSSPTQIATGGTNWKQISVGYSHGTAIKTDGTLWVWGYGGNGRTGVGDTYSRSTPVQTIAGGSNWKQVSTASFHSAAIKTDGTLWTWGWNFNGKLGDGTRQSRSSPVQTISGGTDWKSSHAGLANTFAIKTDGSMYSWGRTHFSGIKSYTENFEQIGSNTTWSYDIDGTNYYSNAGLSSYTAAGIKTDGTLWLWGYGYHGRLGSGNGLNVHSPIQTISGGTNWKAISLATNHTAAIKTDGTLWTWGRNICGELGDNSTISRSSPVQTVAGGTTWKQVSLGSFHSAAIKTDGTLWLWGSGTSGKLGDNTVLPKSSPVQTIAGGSNWKQVASGPYHTGAVKTDGTLWVWGSGSTGRMGTNDTIHRSSPVQTVAGGTTWKQASMGYSHSAAVKTDGTLWVWGHWNAIGTGSCIFVSSPVQTISGGTNWKMVNASFRNTVAVKTDGTLWGWGCNYSGELGVGNMCRHLSPAQAAGTGWKGVYRNVLNNWGYLSNAGLAVKDSNTLWASGSNAYGLHTTDSCVPSGWYINCPTVMGGTTWKQASMGFYTGVAIKTDGTLWTWGKNEVGQVGINGGSDTCNFIVGSPVQTITGGTNWRFADSNLGVTAIKTDGSLWVWGDNTYGNLGTNDTLHRSSPTQIVSSGTWKTVSTGFYDTGAIRDDS